MHNEKEVRSLCCHENKAWLPRNTESRRGREWK